MASLAYQDSDAWKEYLHLMRPHSMKLLLLETLPGGMNQVLLNNYENQCPNMQSCQAVLAFSTNHISK